MYHLTQFKRRFTMDNETESIMPVPTSSEEVVQEEPAVAGETKEQKFIRVGTYRINKTIKDIEQLGNLASKSSYAYSDEQVEKMLGAVEQALVDVKKKFTPAEKKESKFTF